MDLTIFAAWIMRTAAISPIFSCVITGQMDSFWYLYITERFGEATADR